MIRLIVEEPMRESEGAGWCTSEEIAAAEAFEPARRREYFAWRAVVRRELGRDIRIGYDRTGAPVLIGREEFLSVAHCRGRIAVCIADARCAVDIEPESRDFTRAVPRYMTAAEQRLSADPLLPAAVWCAKETLYKYAGKRGLDLLHDLHVEQVDLPNGTMMGRIESGEALQLSIVRNEGFIAVYIA